MRKMWILVSQNPPKTLPKSFRNGWPKEHTIFQRILTIMFLFLYLRFLKNINFTQVKSIFLGFSLNSCFCNFHAFFFQKTFQKPFQNDVQTLPKSMSKMCCFSTWIFWVLDSILEPLGPPTWSQVDHFCLQKLRRSSF